MSLLTTLDRYRRAALHRVLLLDYRRLRRWYWELRAPEMDTVMVTTPEETALVGQLLQEYEVTSLLDVGCGPGRMFPVYQENGVIRLAGVDIARRALRLARDRHPGVTLRLIRAEDLPTTTEFDAVFTNRVLQHLGPEELAAALDRISVIATSLIYLNEFGDLDPGDISGARYMFKHDYIPMLEARGWTLAAHGALPNPMGTYYAFKPNAAETDAVRKDTGMVGDEGLEPPTPSV